MYIYICLHTHIHMSTTPRVWTICALPRLRTAFAARAAGASSPHCCAVRLPGASAHSGLRVRGYRLEYHCKKTRRRVCIWTSCTCYIYMYIHTHIHIFLPVCIRMYRYVYVCCVYVCIRMCMYVQVCVCM